MLINVNKGIEHSICLVLKGYLFHTNACLFI